MNISQETSRESELVEKYRFEECSGVACALVGVGDKGQNLQGSPQGGQAKDSTGGGWTLLSKGGLSSPGKSPLY